MDKVELNFRRFRDRISIALTILLLLAFPRPCPAQVLGSVMVDKTGKPANHLKVLLFTRHGRFLEETSTNQFGVFRFSKRRFGKFTLVVAGAAQCVYHDLWAWPVGGNVAKIYINPTTKI